ncbi:MAG: hypothetical protein EHM30_10780 [Desulfobacteraceae bacterium]|nr:MAG: hypothetical protein EHM30_10780 [Desulfobacteraceae bacterium]
MKIARACAKGHKGVVSVAVVIKEVGPTVETGSEGICGVGAEAADRDATEVWEGLPTDRIARNGALRERDAGDVKQKG